MTLPSSTEGANLLVAVAMGDGPGPGEANAQAQRSRLSDSAGHLWTQRLHHVMFGSIVDVYTAPGTRHGLTVLASRHGRFGFEHRPQRRLRRAPTARRRLHSDVLTELVDGR
ncbi:MAG TPA: hypothetical protein VGH76_24385 [Actinomycetospora sp.]|uniref:hypothetical protein n=1 Tax=Actinomycetospora sp. TaxID=1872135 RepID=UPI002F3EBF6B